MISRLVRDDGRIVVVAIDHALYSWPCVGLEDRARVIEQTAAGGADAFICSYGTLRAHRQAMGGAAPILKLDLTTLAIGGHYPLSEYVTAWTIDDAVRLGAAAVLTFVQLGAPVELEALRVAGRLAAEADRAGLPYVCEIMPVESATYPDPTDPVAITAACRTSAELGAHLTKTTMPSDPSAIALAATFGIPVILAGGDLTSDRSMLIDRVRAAVDAGAAGVAFGRNVWGADDPAGTVESLCQAVHGR
jgi:DhnA family fructose-bisphosphate aldolase class Ia